MAGGTGTKLWPMSRDEKPKQFQHIVSEQTLFQTCVRNLLEAYSPKDIFIATKKKYIKYVLEQTPEIPLKQIIAEPNIKKNQGPATIFAALKVAHYYPDEPFMVIQSDDLREPNEAFLEMISEYERIVTKTRKLISGGIKPLHPIQGVDYFQLGDRYKDSEKLQIHEVEKFIFRPDTFEETKRLIENFNVVTHTNHHCWYVDELMKVTKIYKPQWYEKLSAIKEIIGADNEEELVEKYYSEIEEGANIEEVTKHVFEKDGLISILPFKWTDVGTWGSVYEYFTEGNGNHIDGKVISIKNDKLFLKGNKDKLVAIMGTKNLVVVDTDDVLLICDKDKVGDLKSVFDELDKHDWKGYL